MSVWMYEMIIKKIEGVSSVTLITRVTGFGELQSEMSDRDLCSSFMMKSAWPTWGVPLLLTYPSVCFPKPFDRLLGSPMVSPGGDPVVWVFPSPTWGGGESPACGDALVFCAQRAVVVVHTQAMSRLTRRCSVCQCAPHRSGCVPSFPIRIEWGKVFFALIFCPSSAVAFPP